MKTTFFSFAFVLIGGIAFLMYNYLSLKKKTIALERTLNETNSKSDKVIADKIKLSKRRLETSFDAITDFICAIDESYAIVRVNRSYADYVKLPIKGLLGKKCYEIFWSRQAPCERCPALKTFSSGNSVLKQHFTKRVIDGVKHFDIGTYPVGGPDGRTENVIEYIRDVTDERNIMEQLIRSEKLATIGTMTAGIAHEMINPLSGISGTVTNMLQLPHKYGLNERGKQRLATVMDATARATMIMKDLLHLSRKEDATTVLADINSIIVKAVNAVQLKGFPPIEYKLMLEQTLARVLCDPLKIEQVIINIVTNAVQSIIEKKETLALQGTSHSGLVIVSTQQIEKIVHIDIIDNGNGISEEIKNRIFDPFFTTKSPGEGAGLGLSICQRIIEEHDGRIVVDSGRGLTTFSILLPTQPESGSIII
jgi:two-component system, NtrC family, sensor kinase